MDADRLALGLTTAAHTGDAELVITESAVAADADFAGTIVRLWEVAAHFADAAGQPVRQLTGPLANHGGQHLVPFAAAADCPPLLAEHAAGLQDAPLPVRVSLLAGSTQVCHQLLLRAAHVCVREPERLLGDWGLEIAARG